MKQSYRFVGTEMVIGDTRLTKFGEVIMMTPDERKDAGVKAPLVHDSLFPEFTEQELSLYAYPGQRIDPPAAFDRKLRSAWEQVGKLPLTPAKEIA